MSNLSERQWNRPRPEFVIPLGGAFLLAVFFVWTLNLTPAGHVLLTALTAAFFGMTALTVQMAGQLTMALDQAKRHRCQRHRLPAARRTQTRLVHEVADRV